MKVLFILDHYLLNASANGICVNKLVKEFIERNNEVFLLTFDDEKIIEKATLNLRLQIFSCNVDLKKHTNPWLYYLKWLLPSKHPVTERKNITEAIIKKSSAIIDNYNIDVVVCVHLPIESIVAGSVLKKRFPNVRFVAYMLDSLSGGFLPRHLPSNYCISRKLKWENHFLNSFDNVVLMLSSKTHHIKHSQSQSWYQKAIYLDIPLFVPKQTESPQKNTNKTTNKTIAYVGTISKGVRTPYHFLSVINHIDLNVSIHIAGKNDCNDMNEYITSPYLQLFEYGMISHNDAEKLIVNSDFLLNLGNINPNLVPSKIFEYMSVGKPIISTYCSDRDSCLPYLKKYPIVFLLDERKANYEEQADKLNSFLQNTIMIDPVELISTFKNNTPKAFVDALEYFLKDALLQHEKDY